MQMKGLLVSGGWLAICSLLLFTQHTRAFPFDMSLFSRDSRALPPGEALLDPIEAPERPDHFRNYDELNDYLAQLRKYYTILGRPRFGRSVDRQLESSQSSAEQWSPALSRSRSDIMTSRHTRH